jgi:hypothetical protein
MTVSEISPAVEQATIDYLDRKRSRIRNTDRFLYGHVNILTPQQRAAQRRAAVLAHVRKTEGLPDDTIRQIQKQSQRMATANRVSFAPVYLMQTLKTLADLGLIRLSSAEILSLMPIAQDVPDALLIAVTTFIAKHIPVYNDFLGVRETIKRGCVIGIGGLLELHRYNKEKRQRKRSKAIKLAKALGVPVPGARPKLLPPHERPQAKAAAAAQLKAEIEAARAALVRLYKHRHEARFAGWRLDFIEAASAIPAGYEMHERQRKTVLDLAREMSV